MAPTFKNLPFRGLLSSVLPASVMGSLDTTPGSKAVPRLDVPVPIFYWVEMIISRLQAWTSESVAVWRELSSYRLEKAYHCKYTNSHNEHEFVIYEFSDEQRVKLELRADRLVGERKGNPATDSDSDFSSIDSSDSQSEGSSHSAPYHIRSSRSSSSIASMKEGLSKVPGSLKQLARRLSDSTVSRPSVFSSNQFLADDRIVRIQGHPRKSEVLRTMTFKGDRARWPSLWDIMILIQVVHDDSTMYKLLGRQCYWFADSMFGLLERWSTEHKNGTLSTEPPRRSRWGMKRAQTSTGSLGIVPVHRRDNDQMLKLWDLYLKKRKSMDTQREGFERRQVNVLHREKELRKQLKKEQEEKEQELRERERRLREEQEEKERELRDQLRKEQEERERQLDQLRKEQLRMKDEQNEKDRRLAREQQVRERRMREEQELSERQLTGQLRREQEENERRLKEQFQKQLEDTHLLWQARFMQAMEENDRRFREITQMLQGDASLNESTSTPTQILHPQSHS